MLKAKHVFWLCGAAVLAATTAPALAADGHHRARTVLIEGEAVHPPRGYTEMCARRPELCPARAVTNEMRAMMGHLAHSYGNEALLADAPILTQDRLATLQRVNLTVNRAIQPVEDVGGDVWSLSPVAGDCEEYVMMKRELLAQLGWPRTALRITVVRHDVYEYHAVLVVTTQQGEFVLDNLTDEITTVQNSPYEYVVAQSIRHPGVWVRVSQRG